MVIGRPVSDGLCWYRDSTNWPMGIDLNEKLQLPLVNFKYFDIDINGTSTSDNKKLKRSLATIEHFLFTSYIRWNWWKSQWDTPKGKSQEDWRVYLKRTHEIHPTVRIYSDRVHIPVNWKEANITQKILEITKDTINWFWAKFRYFKNKFYFFSC